MIMKRALLYVTTLSYLRPTQIWALIRARVLPTLSTNLRLHEPQLRSNVNFIVRMPAPHSSGGDYSFCFLNQTREFPDDQIDWLSKGMPKLWRYNLHYFDYLLHAGRSLAANTKAISSWICENRPGPGDAWEPYTLSLRIVNWIKFFIQNPAALQEGWLKSLYRQALWLEKNIEYHLLANHYLKNGVALFFAGMYFVGSDAERWLEKGRRILASELAEQFLTDGGHYERSPMYHAISVMDYLDVLNLITSSSSTEAFPEMAGFTVRINRALEFLDDICMPDGGIPLFNDSALGIAPDPSHILTYGSQVVGYNRKLQTNVLTIKAKPDTGYFILRDGQDMMVIDCGAVGPNYQPGHAHADTLSFVLALNKQRIIVDSGVYDYEPGARRIYARSTDAHNTIKIDGHNQSEVWGVFRLARRAFPLHASLTCRGGRYAKFIGAHDGYARLPGRPIHQRVIEYTSPGEWVILDMISGTGVHKVESYFHIHPSYGVRLKDTTVEIENSLRHTVLTITPDLQSDITIEDGYYFPEFGKELRNRTLIIKYHGEIPVTLKCLMRKVNHHSS